MFARCFHAQLCAALVCSCASASFAANAVIRAVKVNNASIAPSSNIVVTPGSQIVVELRVWGWNADLPGSRLRTYQLTIDGRHGYVSGTSGILLPGGWDAPPDVVDCTIDADCPTWAPDCDSGVLCRDLCINGCPAQYPVCGPPGSNNLCLGLDHTEAKLREFVYIDPMRLDYAHFGLNPIAGVSSVGSVNSSFGSAAFTSTGKTDPGPVGAYYAGTLTIDVPSDASGVFTIGLDPSLDFTFMLLLPPPGAPPPQAAEIIPTPVIAQPFVIEVREGPVVIPASSTWGLVVLALVLLVGTKVVFSARRTAAAE